MGVAKAALEATVRYLAASLGPENIRVNAISAGPIKTLAARGIGDFSTILDKVTERAPLHRNVDQIEVGNTALFLCSPMASSDYGRDYVCGLRVQRDGDLKGVECDRERPGSGRLWRAWRCAPESGAMLY